MATPSSAPRPSKASSLGSAPRVLAPKPKRAVPRPSCSPQLQNIQAAKQGQSNRLRSRSRSRGKQKEEWKGWQDWEDRQNWQDGKDWQDKRNRQDWHASKKWDSGKSGHDGNRGGDTWKKQRGRGKGSGKGSDVPSVIYSQAYISDIPVEFDQEAVRQLHLDCGIAEEDLPISMKILPSKDSTGETCSMIARYRDDEMLQRVLLRMSGKTVFTRSGRAKTVGVCRAKPAKWMIAAGIAKQEKQEGVPTKVQIFNVPVESVAEDILRLHHEQGLSLEDLPVVAVHAPKQPHDETCFAICKYADISNAKRAMDKLLGALVATRSGKQLHLGLRMVDSDDPASASKQALPEGVLLEGFLVTYDGDRAFGFIRAEGHDLFAHRREFKEEDAEANLVPGTRFTFQVHYVPDKQKYEARNCVFVAGPPNSNQLESSFAEDPQEKAFAAPVAEYEQVPGLDYFCEVWELDSATTDWVSRLHPEVQQAVVEEYDDSTRLEPPEEEADRVLLQPSNNMFVTGLPKDFSQASLVQLFSRFGTVERSKILPPGLTALVQMRRVEEATMAVEDLNLQTPAGMPAPLAVRYSPRPGSTAKTEENHIPTGRTLLGTMKTWNPVTLAGFIAMNGSGPDFPVLAQSFVDAPHLAIGSTVLFKVEWNEELSRYIVAACMGDQDNIKLRLMSCAGRGRSVREFARSVQTRLQKGSCEI